MNRLKVSVRLCLCLVIGALSFLLCLYYADAFEMPAADPVAIAQRIFNNECEPGGDCLVEWNIGEDFLSLGLGHFIWYPASSSGFSAESFRDYLEYAREAGEELPAWLNTTPFPPCPWSSREQFMSAKESVMYRDLLDFLNRTRQRQAEYLFENAKILCQKVIGAAPDVERSRIALDLARLASDSQGLYAIIDYVNFKGAGLGSSDHFQSGRWGLLQVMQGMRETQTTPETLREFVRSAKEVLQRRVFMAPFERHEDRWLPGWLRRLDTYLGGETREPVEVVPNNIGPFLFELNELM